MTETIPSIDAITDRQEQSVFVFYTAEANDLTLRLAFYALKCSGADDIDPHGMLTSASYWRLHP